MPLATNKSSTIVSRFFCGLCACFFIGSMPPTLAQYQNQYQNQNQNQTQSQQYYVDGQPISQERYQALQMLNQSIPLLQANRNQEAIDLLLQAEKMAPQMAEIHNNLGLALAKLGRNGEALQELEAAKQLKPELAATWLTLGGLYQSQGQVNEAIATYSEFLQRFPGHKDSSKIASLIAGLKKELANGTIPRYIAPDATSKDNYLAELAGHLTRWPESKLPIKVYIASGKGVPGYLPQYTQILEESFATWQQGAQDKLSFISVKDPSQADLVCSWTNDSNSFTNRAEAGETVVFTNSQGIVKGTIKILTVAQMAELPLTNNRLRQICLHEIGHALGFGGHTRDPQDMMFFSTRVTDQDRSLSPRDAASIKLLYSSAIGMH
ncbi:MAG: Matrixin family metalloprotease [Cyanobacteriota bacterium erpe_2018_sw_21hr_WHONDRS-SW48-000092_B_bin.40]|jgi:tetratricopeptide (TPR) repeat protein|nr:Matrixin family metalloprotease [Cyanobacteriota bacterium erpe_2018_sw_21hr_WHONDRS-SW48-000092_B_bin.40]